MKKYPLIRGLWAEVAVNLLEEVRAWCEIVAANWFYVGIILIGIITIMVKFNPLPPDQIFLGTGQKGSSYRSLGTQFASYFKHYNVELTTVDSHGLSEDLSRVIAPESPVSAGFYVAGSANPEAMNGVLSLGSIQFSPIWVFYRGREGDPAANLTQMLNKKLAVGNERSSSHIIFKKIAALHGVDIEQASNFLKMPHLEAAENLRRGKIDAMVIVDSIDSPLIQSLLHDPEIRILDFPLAEAYIKQLSFLQELVLSQSSLDLRRNYPPKPIHLLSTTVTLLVESETQPVIQWIYLKAARHISNMRQQFFAAPGYFPVHLDRSIPLSKVAKRYYQSGLPPLANFVPLWLADFIDRVWFYLLAGFTILLPTIRLLVASRSYYSSQVLENAFVHLREMDRRIVDIQSVQAADELLGELKSLRQQVEGTWIATNNIREIYSVKSRIKGVVDELNAKRSRLDTAASAQTVPQAPTDSSVNDVKNNQS